MPVPLAPVAVRLESVIELSVMRSVVTSTAPPKTSRCVPPEWQFVTATRLSPTAPPKPRRQAARLPS